MNHEFDEFARSYRMLNDKALQVTGHTSEFFADYKARKLKQWLSQFIDTQANILDFGCGDGLMTYYVARYFPHAQVRGIDPSAESIAVAQRTYAGISWDTLQGAHLPYGDETFDCIYAAAVFHHIDFAQHVTCLAEIFRVLKKCGTFVLFELNPYNPITRFVVKRNPIDRQARLLSTSYAQQMLKGWGSVTINYYGFFPAQLHWFQRLETYLTRLPLGALYACLVQK
jgi:ubiquinone/menaquinone biosynthesis C-methylase UbiE